MWRPPGPDVGQPGKCKVTLTPVGLMEYQSVDMSTVLPCIVCDIVCNCSWITAFNSAYIGVRSRFNPCLHPATAWTMLGTFILELTDHVDSEMWRRRESGVIAWPWQHFFSELSLYFLCVIVLCVVLVTHWGIFIDICLYCGGVGH